jgi:hypothetical protein
MSEDGDKSANTFVCVFSGRTVDGVLSARDCHQTQASRGTLRCRPTPPVPRYAVLAVRWATGPPQPPLHVQTQLPPTVSQLPLSFFSNFFLSKASPVSSWFRLFVDAWAITIPSARFACARTASYRKFAVTTNGLPISMIFSWLMSKRMGSMLWLPRLAEGCSIGQEWVTL